MGLKATECCGIATYSSEFVVACTATEQIIDLCYTICMIGVLLDGFA